MGAGTLFVPGSHFDDHAASGKVAAPDASSGRQLGNALLVAHPITDRDAAALQPE
jgi:hypothetical protein